MFDCCVFVVVVVVVRRRPTSIIRCRARLPSSSPHPLSSASTARFRCSQRDDISVAVISATSSSLPNDNGQRRDRNGRRRRNGRRDGGNGSPLSLTATTSTPPCVTRPPPTSHLMLIVASPLAGNVGICVCRLHPPNDRHLCLSPTCRDMSARHVGDIQLSQPFFRLSGSCRGRLLPTHFPTCT